MPHPQTSRQLPHAITEAAGSVRLKAKRITVSKEEYNRKHALMCREIECATYLAPTYFSSQFTQFSNSLFLQARTMKNEFRSLAIQSSATWCRQPWASSIRRCDIRRNLTSADRCRHRRGRCKRLREWAGS